MSPDTSAVTNPIVKAALEAWQSEDLATWQSLFVPGATLFDDGAPRDLEQFSSQIGKERFTSIDEVRADGTEVVGDFHSDTWGDFKTFFRFKLTPAGKIERLDIGQAK